MKVPKEGTMEELVLKDGDTIKVVVHVNGRAIVVDTDHFLLITSTDDMIAEWVVGNGRQLHTLFTAIVYRAEVLGHLDRALLCAALGAHDVGGDPHA